MQIVPDRWDSMAESMASENSSDMADMDAIYVRYDYIEHQRNRVVPKIFRPLIKSKCIIQFQNCSYNAMVQPRGYCPHI